MLRQWTPISSRRRASRVVKGASLIVRDMVGSPKVSKYTSNKHVRELEDRCGSNRIQHNDKYGFIWTSADDATAPKCPFLSHSKGAMLPRTLPRAKRPRFQQCQAYQNRAAGTLQTSDPLIPRLPRTVLWYVSYHRKCADFFRITLPVGSHYVPPYLGQKMIP